MQLFPIYIKLNRVLIVGGGRVALSKLEKVLKFSTDIRVISKDFLEQFFQLQKQYGFELIQREYRKGDLVGFDTIIVATDIKLQKEIFYESREYRALVNSVDSIEYSDFTFSSFIKRGDLVVSISTNGISPTTAKILRKNIEDIIPTDIEEFLRKIKYLRDKLPKGRYRMELLREKSKKFFLKKSK